MKNSLSAKVLTTLAILAICASAVMATGLSSASMSVEDETAIRDSVKQMETAWNRKQGSMFATPFADDADYVVINGMFLKGREAIGKAHQQIFDTFYKNTTLSLSVKQIRFLRLDVAVVHVIAHLDVPGNEKLTVNKASITMVMSKDKAGWRIEAFQNTGIENPRP